MCTVSKEDGGGGVGGEEERRNNLTERFCWNNGIPPFCGAEQRYYIVRDKSVLSIE